MDLDRLINMITQEVLKRIDDAGRQNQLKSKEEILILGDAGDGHREEYRYIVSVYGHTTFLDDFAVDDGVEQFDRILVPHLSNEDLAGIAVGLARSDVGKIVMEGILCGKQVIVLEEGIRYRRYKDRVNENFYNMFQAYEERMASFGVEIAKREVLCEVLKNRPEKKQIADYSGDAEERGVRIAKKVIVETDLYQLYTKGCKKVYIDKASVVTPLASDYIRTHEMKVVRM